MVSSMLTITLYAACPVYRQLVFVRQFVHTQNGDDVLKFLVPLEYLLDSLGGLVMLLAYDVRVENPGGGFERVHCRIDTQFGDLPAEHCRGIQVGERRGRSRVSQRPVPR